MNKSTDTKRHWGKIPLLLMFISFLFVNGHFQSFAGSETRLEMLSVKLSQATFDEIVSVIENQSEFVFFYKSSDVDRSILYDVEFENKTIHEILDQLTKNSALTYKISGKYIFIDRKAEIKGEKTVVGKVAIPQQQKREITGTVLDEERLPVIGANIIENGTTNGTVTDIDGNFRLQVDEGAVISISYIGYIDQQITTTGTST
ncbi:MAG: carboxypeptidase-like regulatory domain-containing protein, partial [Proteiniphilum sp.]|nr:carboxypeptidase-like regulatory domain-containing protein [Proteiniphilum sp.]